MDDLRRDLTNALDLLRDAYPNRAECELDLEGWCRPHWHYHSTPCPTGLVQALIARHDTRSEAAA